MSHSLSLSTLSITPFRRSTQSSGIIPQKMSMLTTSPFRWQWHLHTNSAAADHDTQVPVSPTSQRSHHYRMFKRRSPMRIIYLYCHPAVDCCAHYLFACLLHALHSFSSSFEALSLDSTLSPDSTNHKLQHRHSMDFTIWSYSDWIPIFVSPIILLSLSDT